MRKFSECFPTKLTPRVPILKLLGWGGLEAMSLLMR